MKILIVGCNGQLGTELMRALQTGRTELGALPAAYSCAEARGVDMDVLDITDLAATRAYVQEFCPDLVINCAAYTNVDGCETHRDEAFSANAIGPRNLAMACETVGARLVQISTDYVFCGDGETPYTEYDTPVPRSVYGATKFMGEEYVRAFCTRWFIVRTSWLYSGTGKNFVKTVLRIGREKGEIRVVDDQLGNPTYAVDLAHHILLIAVTDEFGVYHCTGNGVCSWFAFTKKIYELAGVDAIARPCTTEEYGSKTKRPSYSALDNGMLRRTVGDGMRPWEEALASFLERYLETERA